ncbi:MAG: hypothetical protein ACYCZ0_05110 [Minisyncoccota bacterium]
MKSEPKDATMSLSTARDVLERSLDDKVASVQFSGEATYRHDGKVYSAFQNDEVLMKIEFESGTVMLTKLARDMAPALEPTIEGTRHEAA